MDSPSANMTRKQSFISIDYIKKKKKPVKEEVKLEATVFILSIRNGMRNQNYTCAYWLIGISAKPDQASSRAPNLGVEI